MQTFDSVSPLFNAAVLFSVTKSDNDDDEGVDDLADLFVFGGDAIESSNNSCQQLFKEGKRCARNRKVHPLQQE